MENLTEHSNRRLFFELEVLLKQSEGAYCLKPPLRIQLFLRAK